MSFDPSGLLPLADMLSILIKRFKSLGHGSQEALTLAESLMKVSMLSPAAQAPMVSKNVALTGALAALVNAVEAEGTVEEPSATLSAALARAQSLLEPPVGG